ncbi:hypothetical protein D3C86_1358530 [compost metagenome]
MLPQIQHAALVEFDEALGLDHAGVPAGARLHLEHAEDLGGGLAGTGDVGLVDHEEVRDLHDPRLDGLNAVAQVGRQDEHRAIGCLGDRHLALADPHGLDDHHVAAVSVQDLGRGLGGERDTAELAAAAHAADEDPRIARVALHADAIAEDGPAREGAGRIDRDDPDLEPVPSDGSDQEVGQRALAGPGRPGDAHEEGVAGRGVQLGEGLLGLGRLVLDEGDEAGRGAAIARFHAADVVGSSCGHGRPFVKRWLDRSQPGTKLQDRSSFERSY